MLNKPINAYPHNCCVGASEDLHIKYEIPNAQIDKCSILINRLDSGNCVAQRNESFNSPTNKIDINIGKFSTLQTIVDGQEISLNTGNYFDVKFDKGISLDPGDTLKVHIKHFDSGSGTYNLSTFISGDSLTFENKTVGNKWLIANDIMPTGIRIKKSEDYEYTSGSYVTVTLLRQNNKEYSWSSFYWKTPSGHGESRVITKISKNTCEFFVKAKGDYSKQITYDEDDSVITTYSDVYDEKMFLARHEQGETGAGQCRTGTTLKDYFGFDGFWASRDMHHTITQDIGLDKCIIEVYDSDGTFVDSTRILAYEYDNPSSQYFYIYDNPSFFTSLRSAFDHKKIGDYNWLVFGHILLYNIDNLEKQENINGIAKHGDKYYLIKNSKFSEYGYAVTVCPSVDSTINIGDEIEVWSHEDADFNTTPTYYFRTKTPPTANIMGVPALKNSVADGVDYISDIKHKFKISYESDNSKLNYFYLYLYALNPYTNEWVLKERSPMLHSTDDAYEFSGFIKGQKYKIYGVCTDNDGDEWNTAEVQFDVRYNFSNTKDLATFNKDSTTVDISFDGVLSSTSSYPDISLEVYKILKSNSGFVSGMDYVGGGLAKINNIICFNKLRDYNIRNDSYYDYYVRVVVKRENMESVRFYLPSENVHTDFSGTSILGIEKISDAQLNISKSFNLFYHFDKDVGELTNELSREYINSFSRYPKELKGHQNYISGNCSGLLGSECNGIYEEPKGIRDSWKDFINDDTIKFYRGIDGETMIISIESSKITPSYFPGVGIVNEVYITFKELSPTNQYAVFSTEKTGD